MNRMKLKNNKKKTIKFKFKYLFFFLFVYISFSFSYYFLIHIKGEINSSRFIDMLLKEDDTSFIYKNSINLIVNKTMNYLFSIDINNPSTILNNTVFRNNYREILADDSIMLEDVEMESDYIKDPYSNDIENPIIYLYNSHQLENYNSDYLEIYGIKPNVQMASYLLREKLGGMGIKSIVEDSDISQTLKNKGWGYYKSYDVTRELINDKKSMYPSLKYYIDIHRDSIDKKYTTIDIDGKYYAKVLFILGMEYESYENNFKTMSLFNQKIEEMYPGLSRGILKKNGKGFNGVYNQDIDSNVMLIEVGSVYNTIEEVNNTISALANVINSVLGGDNNKST